MSWASSIIDSLGSVLGYDDPNNGIGSQLGDYLGGSSTPGTGGNSGFGSYLPALITAGTSLAGNYFTNANNAEINSANLQQAQNKIEADKQYQDKALANQLAIANIQAGASSANAKRAALSSLYNNWASLRQRGGADLMQGALETGRNAASPLMANISRLR